MQKIKNLVKVNFDMDYGVLVDNPLKLMKFDESDNNVYISRKALKHFVESRKKEMAGIHSSCEILEKLYFSIDNTTLTYNKFDLLQVETSGKLVYIKYFTELRNSNLRIVIEPVDGRLEICSIHFQKYKKPP